MQSIIIFHETIWGNGRDIVTRRAPENLSVLERVRKELKDSGRDAFGAAEANPALDEIMDQIQALRMEMNIAKKQAAEKAAAPFLEQINQLESDYALILKLSA